MVLAAAAFAAGPGEFERRTLGPSQFEAIAALPRDDRLAQLELRRRWHVDGEQPEPHQRLRLYHFKWSGSGWSRVASSTSSTSSEHIAYSGTSGYYYWRIYSYSGSGSYQLWLDTP